MRPPTATTFSSQARWSMRPLAASIHGRAAAYRRLSTAILASRPSATQQTCLPSQNLYLSPILFLRSEFLPQDVLFRASSAYARHFSSHSALLQQAQKQPEPDVRDRQQSTASDE